MARRRVAGLRRGKLLTASGSLPRVAAIGSCRVLTPLGLLAEAGRVEYRQQDCIGYNHAAPEVLQTLRLLRGEVAAPAELGWLLGLHRPDRLGTADLFARCLAPYDCLVVEISSIRTLLFRGWHLQLHRFRRMLHPVGIDDRQVSRLFSKPGLARRLADQLGDGEEAAWPREVLGETRCREMDAAALDASLAELRAAVPGRLLLVGTLTQNRYAVPIAQRVLTRDALATLAAQAPETWSADPTATVLAHGVDTMMQDLGHYRDTHMGVIAGWLATAIANLLDRQV